MNWEVTSTDLREWVDEPCDAYCHPLCDGSGHGNYDELEILSPGPGWEPFAVFNHKIYWKKKEKSVRTTRRK